ncbi:putative Granaticin polyketide synthase ketoacyl reductase 2 [Sphingomonas sp. EC-HK361]|uniref:SDR family NAD(P)-dependent oxidoreductase n=1 Tax=Sphingomonas sp. EC-HK361 TaxID=2038397 RepID=UPI0012551FEA|nr:SDR family oxidoreductase [Sphingomonas sp. EC-HK361]VVT03929.1 putative Granaticin polyketide synthase ketoacyl reductase 2 [Sphingomonas sp. EC-HK361]
MDGSVAIVTGGGTGIGAAAVRRLVARGVRCVINYASSREDAEALAAEVGNGSIAVQADIAEDAACRALAKAATDAFGRIDFLVNNAGRTKFANHEDLDALSGEDFVDIYRLNTVAAFQMIRACAPAMKASPHGAVVNVASVAGVFGIGSSVAYAASKGALITMSKSLARVLAPEIRVNAVAPGYVGTGWFEKRLGEAGFAALNDRIAGATPLAMAAGPDDIAGPIVMLLDPASRVMTGEVLLLDAGAHLDIGLSRRPGREI